MENEEKKNYSTRDLWEAATLVSLGFYVMGTDYQIEGNRQLPVGYFQFESTDELIETIKKYRRGQLAVEPLRFSTNLKMLKAEVNGVYKSPYSTFNQI